MPSVEEVFKVLSADEKFIARVKLSLTNVMKDGKIDQYDAPELVFLITDAYNEMSNLRLTYEELPVLIKMLYNFMIEKFDLIPMDKREDFSRLVDIAIKLVMIQPKVEQQVTKCMSWFSCFKASKSTQPIKTTTNSIQSGIEPEQVISETKIEQPIVEKPEIKQEPIAESEVKVESAEVTK